MRGKRKRVCYPLTQSVIALMCAGLFACGGGDDGGDGNTGVDPVSASISCDGYCTTASSFLTVTEVQQVIAQAVAEAKAQGASATIAVVDRVGNVLAVFHMNGAATQVTISSGGNVAGGLEGINIIPDSLAAISKAVTGAYLSSEGNAFTTRTASQIIQDHFAPGENNQPGGPLFGVQFSQLPCSDFSRRFAGGAADAGPKRSPLGLSADPGGVPLYKGGSPVGAVGVIADGVYGLDKNIIDVDSDVDERIAIAATRGFAAPVDRRADRITVGGKFLRFSDALFSSLSSNPASIPNFSTINGADGNLVAVPGYANAAVIAGTAFGQAASGIRSDGGANFSANLDAFVVVDSSDTPRYPPSAGTDTPNGSAANTLTAAEVKAVLSNALGVANRARAQIRRPLGSSARVSIAVVDTNGAILGVVRSRDAPVFGTDVAVQKARTAMFFSGTGPGQASTSSPADAIRGVPNPVYLDGGLTALASPAPITANYVGAVQSFTGVADALEATGNNVAFSDRAGGNMSRPFFPDGLESGPPGPFSKPAGQWSIFSTGLQLDLVYNAIVHHVGFVAGAVGSDVGAVCTGDTGLGGFASSNPITKIANGIQIFPGSVPIYRGNVLVGGIGVSGDGVDQDDLVAFLGVANASSALSGAINNAPAAIRADTLSPQGIRLRFVSCPQSPFNDNDQQNVCDGL